MLNVLLSYPNRHTVHYVMSDQGLKVLQELQDIDNERDTHHFFAAAKHAKLEVLLVPWVQLGQLFVMTHDIKAAKLSFWFYQMFCCYGKALSMVNYSEIPGAIFSLSMCVLLRDVLDFSMLTSFAT